MAGTGRIYRRGTIYDFAYRWDGREYRESARTIFDRYNIVQEAELHHASARLCAYLSARPTAPPVTLGVVAGS